MAFAYDDKKRQVILTERNGSKTVYIHDSKYRNTDILYEDGTKEHFGYNGKNQRILYTDRNGNTTWMAYDNRGNLTQVVNVLGTKLCITYDDGIAGTYFAQMREYKPELGRFAGQDIRQGIAQIPLSKFVSPDGHREVIYDANGNIVTASEDVGTYNFYPSNKNGFLGFAGHACHDVIPWIW